MTERINTDAVPKQSRPQIGSFVLSHDPTIARVAATAGLDFLLVDAEHGLFSPELVAQFVDVAKGLDISMFVRCTMNQITEIHALFDHGLDGVLVAGARTVDDVRHILRQLKYPPLGLRGLNPFVPAADFGGMDKDMFMTEQNTKSRVWVLAENQQLLANLHDICALPGLDGLFFGPYDLSIDLGVPAQINHELVVTAIRDACQTVRLKGLGTGIFSLNPASMKTWRDLDLTLLALGFDWSTLRQTWHEWVSGYREPSEAGR